MMITAGKFKAECLKIMDDVQRNRHEIIITKYGKPVAKLVGIEPKSKKSLYGLLKNTVVIKGDIIGPIEEKWNAV